MRQNILKAIQAQNISFLYLVEFKFLLSYRGSIEMMISTYFSTLENSNPHNFDKLMSPFLQY